MILLTKHAREAIAVRNIGLDWIEATVSSPDFVEADPHYSDRTRSFKAIAEFGGRMLGLCIGQRAMILWSLQCISIAEPGDDQDLL